MVFMRAALVAILVSAALPATASDFFTETPAGEAVRTVEYVIPGYVLAPPSTEEQRHEDLSAQLLVPQYTSVWRLFTGCKFSEGLLGFGHLASQTVKVFQMPVARIGLQEPDQTSFKLKLSNKGTQVLNLTGTIFTVTVGSSEMQVDLFAKNPTVSPSLLPDHWLVLEVSTPPMDTLAKDTAISVAMYSAPTKTDAAGTVAARGKFVWAFKVSKEKRTESTAVRWYTQVMTTDQREEICRKDQPLADPKHPWTESAAR